jgi:hypothetical protein
VRASQDIKQQFNAISSNASSTPKGLDGPADKKTNTFLSRHQRVEETSKNTNAKVI